MADVYIDICKNIIAILPYMHTPILYTMHYNIHVQTAQRSYTSPGIGLHKAPYPCERGRAVNCSEHRARKYDKSPRYGPAKSYVVHHEELRVHSKSLRGEKVHGRKRAEIFM
jgi:hypothetical protein